ncbi:hypothetical protein CP488_01446 [Chthonomonas calidirosea]|nr:hypothetical protein CP488_01446 [Chthonomonas calidirosea]
MQVWDGDLAATLHTGERAVKLQARGSLVGRVLGVLVFLGGVGLLGWVFYIAYGLFTAPASTALDLRFTGNPKTDPTLALIAARFGWLLFRVILLMIMAFSGSLITQKGINLFLCAGHHGGTETPSER